MRLYNHQIQNKELAESAAYAEDQLRSLASFAVISGIRLSYKKILSQDSGLHSGRESLAGDFGFKPEAAAYADVLDSISANPVGYARAVKKLKAHKPLTGSELRMGIRGLVGAGNFSETDTSDKRVIVKKNDTNITVDVGNGSAVQTIQRGEEMTVRKYDDSILIGELPYNAEGRSLEEVTEEYLAVNIGYRTSTPWDFTVEQADMLKRAGIAISHIRSDSMSQRRDFEKQNEWLTRNRTDDGHVQPIAIQVLNEAKQARSTIAVADMKDVYLQLDAELAARGVPL